MTTMGLQESTRHREPFIEGSWPEVLTRPLRAIRTVGSVVLHAVTHPNPAPSSELIAAMEALSQQHPQE